MVAGADQKDSQEARKNSYKYREKSAQKLFDRADIVRDVRLRDFQDLIQAGSLMDEPLMCGPGAIFSTSHENRT